MADPAALLFKGISELVLGAVKKRVAYETESFLTQLRIEQALEKSVRRVVEQLVPFLEAERISDQKQQLLVQTALNELGVLIKEPERLFKGSLDGQRVFDQLCADRPAPEELVQEDLVTVYVMIGPRITSLLCDLPSIVEHWKQEKYREDYRRFDEFNDRMQVIANRLDAMAEAPIAAADEILRRFKQALTQRLEMDLTGLRLDQPMACRFDDLFVHPELRTKPEDNPKSMPPVTEGVLDESSASHAFLTRGGRALVLGQPGAGKSTWTKWLTRSATEERPKLAAIRVELRQYAKGDPPAFQVLLRQAAGTHLAEFLDPERIRRWADAGELAFILDGFDELPPERRTLLRDWIDGLSREVRDCPLILTSRPLTTNHVDTLGPEWVRWSIVPFDRQRIVRYIVQWYRHMPLLTDTVRDVDAEDLASKWQADPTIGPLTGNPLLLSTLLVVHHLDGDLPLGRAALYRRYVEGMLGAWDDRRHVVGVSIPLRSLEKRKILQGLALRMQLSGQDQLDESATVEAVRDILAHQNLSADPASVLAALRERTGLLAGPGAYSFTHKSIAEFLVAEAVLDGTEKDENGTRLDRFLLFRNRHQDRWNSIMFLWAGLAPSRDVEEFVVTCMETGGGEDLSLAIGILIDQRGRLPESLHRQALDLVLQCRDPEFYTDLVHMIFEPKKPGQCRIPGYFRVRGISTARPEFVVRAWIDLNVLSLNKLDPSNQLHCYLWYSLSLHTDDIRMWAQCLQCIPAHPQNQVLRERLARIVLRYRLRGLNADDALTTLSTYADMLPMYAGRRIFVVLEHIVRIWFRDDHSEYRRIYNLLSAVTVLVDGPVDDDWLRGCAVFALPRGSHEDIIEASIARIERGVAEEHFSRDDVVEASLASLVHLKARRIALLANGPDAASTGAGAG